MYKSGLSLPFPIITYELTQTWSMSSQTGLRSNLRGNRVSTSGKDQGCTVELNKSVVSRNPREQAIGGEHSRHADTRECPCTGPQDLRPLSTARRRSADLEREVGARKLVMYVQ